ncbi:MAG: DUF2029 domain-containing protein [Chloroflexi bacterium]|nr:DUF2029 domain-containing protein [Chloroflexota bacterium]
MTINSSSRPNLTQWLALGLLLLLLFAADSYAMYIVFSSRFPGAADFFPRWFGGRVLLLEGRNPYEREVALEAQLGLFGRYTQPWEDQVGFAYPLYTFFLFWPLVYTPYAVAQAMWMVVLQFVLIFGAILCLNLVKWKIPSWLLALTMLWAVFFYPGARSVILGQFSVIVFGFFVAALWAIEQRWDYAAGACLALTTIKPQMVFMLIPLLLLWAFTQRRWQLIIGFGGALLILTLTAMLFVPTWLPDFYNGLFAYSGYVGFYSPIENLTRTFAAPIAIPLANGLSIVLIGLMLFTWWQVWRFPQKSGWFVWALMLTLIIGSLVAFRSATTNHVILYLPLFLWFRRISELDQGEIHDIRPCVPLSASHLVFLLQTGLNLLLWFAFVKFIIGTNFEHPFMHGFLPLLLLLLYLADWRGLFRIAQKIEAGV